MLEKSLTKVQSQTAPLDQLKKLILANALHAKQNIVISKGTLAFFYHAYVANSLAENGFVLSPPAFSAPEPIEIRWGQWQGITHIAHLSKLKEYDEINAWSMNWLSQKIGQQFYELIKYISSNTEKKFSEPTNLKSIDLLILKDISPDELVRISYNYRLGEKEFESVPVYPIHLLKIIERLGFNISLKANDAMCFELFLA